MTVKTLTLMLCTLALLLGAATLRLAPPALAAPSNGCLYDITPDGVVDAVDIQAITAAWRTALYDFDGDGANDLDDVMAASSAFGQPCAEHLPTLTPTATQTPTPSVTPTPSKTPTPNVGLRQEAEHAFERIAPMERRTDADASNCDFVLTPFGQTGGAVRFKVNIEVAGSYYVWGRYSVMVGRESETDSFRIQVDNGPAEIWRLAHTPWIWRPAEVYPYGTRYRYNLGAGEHTVTIHTSEDGAMLDVIELTRSSSDVFGTTRCHLLPTVTPTPGPVAESGRLAVGGLKSFWGDWAMQIGYYFCDDPDARTNCKPTGAIFDEAKRSGYDFLSLSDDMIYMNDAAWQGLQTEADRVNQDGRFTAIRGYEFTGSSTNNYYNHEGHVMSYGLNDYFTAPSTLRDFYPWLAQQANAIGMMNHPRRSTDFDPSNPSSINWELSDFEYHPAVDEKIQLAQISPAVGTPLERILSAGWHVGVGGWGFARDRLLPDNRVYGALMPSLSRTNFMDALRNRRTWGVERSREAGLALAFQAEGVWMGSSVDAGPTFDFQLFWKDNRNRPLTKIELVGMTTCDATGTVLAQLNTSLAEGNWTGSVPNTSPWYHIRVYDSTGLVGWTSPIWSHRQFETVAGATTRTASAWARLDSGQPQVNFNGQQVRVAGDGTAATAMRFDLSHIPAGKRVRTALLKLTTDSRGNNTTDMNITVWPLLRSWTPSQVTWNQAAAGQAWQVPGAGGGNDRGLPQAIIRTRLISLAESEGGGRRPYYWDLTSLAQQWVDNPTANHGFLFGGCGPVSIHSFSGTPELILVTE